MDSLKKPEMILSMANTAAIIGMATYFYKQNVALRNEIEDIDKSLQAVIKQIKQMQGVPQQLMEVASATGDVKKELEAVKKQVEVVREIIDEYPESQEVDALSGDIDAIISALKENGVVEVERIDPYPPRRPSPPRGRRGLRAPQKPTRARGRERDNMWTNKPDSNYRDYDNNDEDEDPMVQIAAVRRQRGGR